MQDNITYLFTNKYIMDNIISAGEAAAILGISYQTFAKMRVQENPTSGYFDWYGNSIPYLKEGKSYLVNKETVQNASKARHQKIKSILG